MRVEHHGDSDTAGEANDIISLMLGATRELESIVKAAEARSHLDASSAPTADDPLLAAALGLISFRRSLKRWCQHAIIDCQRRQPQSVDLSADGVSLR
jgi:hypothetical protein